MTHSHIAACDLFLQTHYIKNIAVVKRFYDLDLFLFHWESGSLFGPVFRRMTHIQTNNKQQQQN